MNKLLILEGSATNINRLIVDQVNPITLHQVESPTTEIVATKAAELGYFLIYHGVKNINITELLPYITPVTFSAIWCWINTSGGLRWKILAE